MVRKILSGLAALAVVAGLGIYVSNFASASSSSGGLCAKNGTRVVTYFPGGCPAGSFAISFPAGTTVVLPAPLTATDPSAGETAATLAQDPSVVATDTTVPLKWAGATPPSGTTIASYALRFRLQAATVWTPKSAAITVLHSVVTGLTPNTSYDFQVQALYKDSTVGPWSNTVSVTTKSA